jgi:hypothetical protein
MPTVERGQSGLPYAVDIVFCIDATGSMEKMIDEVKANALKFEGDLKAAMENKQKMLSALRVRVIAFRDYEFDGPDAMVASPFYELPAQREAFLAFVSRIAADGGGDSEESSLEALSLAINSEWARAAGKRRQIIVLWTDDAGKKLEEMAAHPPANYPRGMPASFGELTALWEGQTMSKVGKRILVFAPDAYPWSQIQTEWQNSVHIVSKAGKGLKELDYNAVLHVITESIG